MTARRGTARGRLAAGAVTLLLATAGATPAAAQVTGRGFIQASHLRFAASRSIEATTGSPTGFAYGGGAQIGIGWLFVQGGVERYEAAARRVFVLDDRVFDLGIPNRVTITPLQLTTGYRAGGRVRRLRRRRLRYVPVCESAPFGPQSGRPDAAPESAVAPPLGPPYGGDVRETHRSWHVLGGVETALLSWLWIGGEGQWTWVPDALGAAAFRPRSTRPTWAASRCGSSCRWGTDVRRTRLSGGAPLLRVLAVLAALSGALMIGTREVGHGQTPASNGGAWSRREA